MHKCTRRETTSPSIHFPLTYLSSVYPNTWMTTLPFGSAASFTRASFTFLRQAFPKPGCFYMRCFSILQCHEIVNMITRVLNVQSGSLQVHGFGSRGEHSSMSSRLLGCCMRYKQVWHWSHGHVLISGTHFLTKSSPQEIAGRRHTLDLELSYSEQTENIQKQNQGHELPGKTNTPKKLFLEMHTRKSVIWKN